ncbi:MAG: MFS transporter [Pseudolysinimonas sp.]
MSTLTAVTAIPRRGLAMGILVFASFMDLLDVTIVQIALPTIREDLGATPAQLEWTVSGYMLAFAVLLITGGRLGDIFGRRGVFVVGVAGFTLASVAAGLAGSADLLVGARTAQGAFAALMVPQTLATLQALYTPKERAPMLGVIGGVSGLSAVVAPLLGGWLITADVGGSGWRSIFFLNVPIGILVLILALAFVPNTRSNTARRLDLRGVLLLSGALVALLYPLVEGSSLGWPAWLWMPALGGVFLAVIFVIVELRRERADGSSLLPMRLFRDRGFSTGLITQALFQGSMNAFSLVLLVYVQAALGFDAFGAGLTLLSFSVGAILGMGVAIPLASKGSKYGVTAGLLIEAGGLLWIMTIIAARGIELTGWDLAIAFAVTGVGLALVVVPLVDIALATVPIADAGAASGAYGTFQQIGAAVGVAISATVFFGIVGDDWSQPHVLEALWPSICIAIGGYLLAAVATLFLPNRAAVREHVEHQAELVAIDRDV